MDRIVLGDAVWLRPLMIEDAADIVAAVREPDVVRYTRVPAPYGAADAEAFISGQLVPAGERPTTFAIAVADADRPEGRLRGVVGIEVDSRSATGEVGYWIAPDARGSGITRRAAHAVCRYGFDVLGLERLHLCAVEDNPASNAIARRLGFTEEGVARQGHLYRDVDGTPTGRGDLRLWGLLPGELADS